VIERIIELLDGASPARPSASERIPEAVAGATPSADISVETLSDDDALRQLMGQS
jgi:hypothetical protein